MELVLLTSLKLIQAEYILNFAYLYVSKSISLAGELFFFLQFYLSIASFLTLLFFSLHPAISPPFCLSLFDFSSTRFISLHTLLRCDVNHLNDFRSLLQFMCFTLFFSLIIPPPPSLFRIFFTHILLLWIPTHFLRCSLYLISLPFPLFIHRFIYDLHYYLMCLHVKYRPCVCVCVMEKLWFLSKSVAQSTRIISVVAQ